MPKLIAINEIIRDGKDGKREVIAPGAKFDATVDEKELLVDRLNAAKGADADEPAAEAQKPQAKGKKGADADESLV